MKQSKLEHNAEALKRWRTRLKRAMTMIDKLEKQRGRLEKAATRVMITKELATPEPLAVTIIKELAAPEPPKSDDLAIPAFLQRKKLDPVAEQIAADQAATKKAKARGRIEKMKAKKRGDLKKMPLTGKAALEAIRNG